MESFNMLQWITYRQLVQEYNHTLLVFKYEWVDNLHIRFFAPKLNKICQVL